MSAKWALAKYNFLIVCASTTLKKVNPKRRVTQAVIISLSMKVVDGSRLKVARTKLEMHSANKHVHFIERLVFPFGIFSCASRLYKYCTLNIVRFSL